MGLAAQGDGVAVHIPLHVGDGGAVQNAANIFHDIILDLRLAQVQQKLMAAQNIRMVVMQRPVGMLPVQVGVRVYGFRLEPEAEFHAFGADLLCQTVKTVGELLFVHVVVAQARQVVVPAAEPAVVQDEQLAAKLLCPVRQVQQPVLVEVEHTALPVVVQDGPGAAPPVGRDDVVVYEPVHPLAQAAKALVGYAEDGFRAFEDRTGGQFVGEVTGGDALHHPGQALEAPLGGGIVIGGVDQVEAVDPAPALRGTGLAQQEAGIGPVGGCAGDTFDDGTLQGHRGHIFPHFRDPAAAEGGHFVFAGQVDAEAHELVENLGGIAGVLNDGAAGQGGFEQAVVQLQPQARLLQGDLQGFAAAVGLGQGGHKRCGAVQNAVVYITQVRGGAADLQGTLPVVAPAAAAPFQGLVIGTTGGVALPQQHTASPAKTGPAGESLRVLRPHRRAEVQMLRLAVGIHPKQVRKQVVF